jgi:hypothetical protein
MLHGMMTFKYANVSVTCVLLLISINFAYQMITCEDRIFSFSIFAQVLLARRIFPDNHLALGE